MTTTRPTGAGVPAMSEAAFQSRVVDYAKFLQILVFHDHDSRRNSAGFPDLVLVGTRILFVELKAQGGRLRPEQSVWLERIRAALGDAAAVVWRPSDWPEAAATLRSMRWTR